MVGAGFDQCKNWALSRNCAAISDCSAKRLPVSIAKKQRQNSKESFCIDFDRLYDMVVITLHIGNHAILGALAALLNNVVFLWLIYVSTIKQDITALRCQLLLLFIANSRALIPTWNAAYSRLNKVA